MKLREAIEIVNTARRGPRDPPLVVLAKCQDCRQEFALPSQVASRIELAKGELPTLCRPCSLNRRRASRRVGGK